MGSISTYITPLVITNLGGRHIDTDTETDMGTQTHTYIHILCGQDQFLEIRLVPAAGCREPD